MADENDDLLNFEDGDFEDGNLNEDELLLSDEDDNKFDDDDNSEQIDKENPCSPSSLVEERSEEVLEEKEISSSVVDHEAEQDEPSKHSEHPVVASNGDAPQTSFVKLKPKESAIPIQPNQNYRPRFQRWPHQHGGGPRWNNNGPPMQNQMINRGPMGHPMGPNFMRPMRPNQFYNSFPLQRPMQQQQRFLYKPNDIRPPGMPRFPPAPSNNNTNIPAIPRKVLINPNFKGGVEAAKNQLLKDQMLSSSSLTEDELLRKQEEFINQNVRQIEKRRYEHDRSPSPRRSRRRSYSTSPPRYRKRPFRNNERRGPNDGRNKDENLPEEDEETRAYREKIELQRKKREEILKQKEMRRKQQQAEKVKETLPTEPLKPIVVTDKKIVLTKVRSTTPPIKETAASTRRIVVLKSPAKMEPKLDIESQSVK